MTSDAKIGLLLGLVFIFIIAFIVNGLPSLRTETAANDLTKNSVLLSSEKGSGGLGAKVRNADGAIDKPEPVKKEAAEPAAEPAGGSEVRFTSPLPQSGFVVKEEPAPENVILKENPAGTGLLEEKWAAVKDVKPADVPGATGERTADAVKTDGSKTTEAVKGSEPGKKAESARAAAAKTYVVANGDMLSSIAKKFYGAEEGNKTANINLIFEANRRVLKSADVIYAGQQLVIPPLPGAKADKEKATGTAAGAKTNKGKPAGTLPKELFEPVKSVGGRGVLDNAAVVREGGYYVVRDGDNLWKIAASQLGNGARYKEIRALNGDVVKNENDVRAGVRLKMPAKK